MIPLIDSETRAILKQYSDAIEAWTKTINLVAPSTLANLWERHILDCLQVSALVPDTGLTWCDIGSGAGLPGLVTAIARRNHVPQERHVLIEADQRKAAFLKLQVSKLGICAEIIAGRIETSRKVGADIVTARALAPLDRLIGLAKRHARPDARLIFMKGADYAVEISAAAKKFSFECEVFESQYSDGRILILRNIRELEHLT